MTRDLWLVDYKTRQTRFSLRRTVCITFLQKLTETTFTEDFLRVQMSTTLHPKAQNLRQGIVMKTSFKTRVSLMGLGSFVDINIFVMKYYFI